MKYTIERTFIDIKHTCRLRTYRDFDDILGKLIYKMRGEVGHSFIGEYNNLKFVMNIPFYNEFSIACQMAGKKNSEWCRGVKIIEDPTLYIGDRDFPDGIVRLVYEEADIIINPYCIDDMKAIRELYHADDLIGHGFQRVPHIDHVRFNGPATIVFWKDGTKTVVKYDGKGRKDRRLSILYAFMRKIYGEGKPYHNILNEIEEALK